MRLLSLLHKEGLKCQLRLKVEGAHDVGSLEVFILVLHHIDDIIDFFLLVDLRLLISIKADVILKSP